MFRFIPYQTNLIRLTAGVAILLLLAATSACDPGMVYEKNTPIDPEGWPVADKKPFELEVNDTLSLLNFYVNIRHTTDYKYRNIFLFFDTFYPEGSQSRDTIEIMLADNRGKWYGKGIGNIRNNQVLLKRGFSFPQKGSYKFRFEQGMREPELKGILDVGIRIEKM